MATFTPGFRSVSRQIHSDHESLIDELNELEGALDDLAGSSALFAYRAAAECVARCGQRLSQMLPEHFMREETLLFDIVAKVSPELMDFAREMRSQHQALRGHLGRFCTAVQQLDEPPDRALAVNAATESGRTLATELREHVLLEESELTGFL